MRWEVEGVLMTSSRPGYPDVSVSAPEIKAWVDSVKKLGIKSVICLLDTPKVAFYNIKTSLVNFYKVHGLDAIWLPTIDHKEVDWQVMSKALTFFNISEGPVLIHCSAGLERSVVVAEHIVKYHNWRNVFKEEVA
ncbi:MAG TPA: hypothetical protein VMV86_06680 [Methanosarcinales archaeon]|nr:hypothetical protein [Methanosarcinales archaeon]